MSLLQSGLWFLQTYEDVGAAYNIPLALRLSGDLQIEPLRRAIIDVINRHEVLRSVFVEESGNAHQVVRPAEDRLHVLDFSKSSTVEQETAFEEIWKKERLHDFDLEVGPLIRFLVIKLNGTQNILIVNAHHLVMDGWSLKILWSEISECYTSYTSGLDPQLKQLEHQYSDFALLQRKEFADGAYADQISYWKEQLSDAPKVLQLPSDRSRPVTRSYKGASLTRDLPDSLLSDINQLADQQDATPFMVLLAALKVLLHKYTGDEDLVVGTPIAVRTHAFSEHVIGFFGNTLAMRSRPNPEVRFDDFLDTLKATCLDAYANHDVPFDKVVEAVNPARDASYNPLVQVMLVMHPDPLDGFDLPGVVASQQKHTSLTSKFDLTIFVQEDASGLKFITEYATDLFEEETIAQLLRCYQTLLRSIVSMPTACIEDLEILTQEEKNKLLHHWNDTEVTWPDDLLVHEMFEKQAQRCPDAIAVQCERGSTTYGELEKRSTAIAQRLVKAGVERENVVGICVERSVAMVEAILGVMKAGAAYLPLDQDYPIARLSYMIDVAEAKVVIGDQTSETLLDELGIDQLRLGEIGAVDDTQLPKVAPQDLVYVIFTSGSTGKPKGVQVQHNSLRNYVNAVVLNLRLSAFETFALLQNISVDFGVTMLFPSIVLGKRLFIPRDKTTLDASELSNFVQGNSIDVYKITPTHLSSILADAVDPKQVLPRKAIVLGGEKATYDLLKKIFDLSETDISVFNHYGPTETTIGVLTNEFTVASPGFTQLDGTLPLGLPLANTQIHVLDRGSKICPNLVWGEIAISGEGVFRGYIHSDVRADHKKRQVLLNSGFDATVYCTGDIGRRRHDGSIEIAGRKDDQINLRGHRIEPSEVIAALLACDGVNQATVFEMDPPDKDGTSELVAVVISSRDLKVDEVKHNLRRLLPSFMVPSKVFRLSSFPRLASGKLDLKALASLSLRELTHNQMDPRLDEFERQVAEIWSSVLGQPVASNKDDFFALGGHSLLAIQMLARVRTHFGSAPPIRTLFNNRSLESFCLELQAILVSDNQRHARSTDIPSKMINASGRSSLSLLQSGLWFLQTYEDVGAAYNIPLALRLSGDLQIEPLRRAIIDVINRHEVLRSVFVEESGNAHQVVRPAEDRLHVLDFSKSSTVEQETAFEEIWKKERLHDFDLEVGPLIRFLVIKLNGTQNILIVNAHHLVMDGWSLKILWSEISECYTSYTSGLDPQLKQLEHQYSDFALLQRKEFADGAYADQISYWKEQLSDAPKVLQLPSDRSRPVTRSYKGASLTRDLPDSLLSDINQLADQQDATPFMVLLAALKVLLHKYTGDEDLVVGTPIAVRTHAFSEHVIGFFGNTLAMRSRPNPEVRFDDFLDTLKATCLDAYANHDVPFDKVVEAVNPARDASYNPLVQVMLVMHPDPLDGFDLPGVVASQQKHTSLTSKFDLTIFVQEDASGLKFITEYATDLFEEETIAQLLRCYQTLLRSIVSMPTACIEDLEILTQEEKNKLLHHWNDTEVTWPDDLLVHEMFEKQAQRCPDAIAVQCERGSTTYGELEKRSTAIAQRLVKAGVERENVVGICVERSVAMVEAILGVMKAGAAYLPLDQDYPIARLSYMIDVAEAKVVIGDQTSETLLDELGIDQLRLGEIGAVDDTQLPKVAPQDLVYVIFTSGSTGKPKGVQVQHNSLRNLIKSFENQLEIHKRSKFFSVTQLTFDIANLEILLPLSAGAACCISSKQAARDAESLSKEIEAFRPLIIQATPAMWRTLQAVGWKPRPEMKLIVGGEALSEEVAAYLTSGGSTVLNAYGPTEATIWCTTQLVKPHHAAQNIGFPLQNTKVFILDSRMEPVPFDIAGELYISGVNVARGYINNTELTENSFVTFERHNFRGRRLYRTGDQVKRKRDGSIEFIGRNNTQLKLRGHRIELGEITTLLDETDFVRESSALISRPGEANAKLVAFAALNKRDLNRDAITHDWLEVYESVFSEAEVNPYPSWVSSLTGDAIPRAEMDEWLLGTINKLKKLNPKRVCEVGVGTGLVLKELAASCERYWGSDISDEAIKYSNRFLNQFKNCDVQLFVCPAHDSEKLFEGGPYDLVIINSVAQYFPDLRYLKRLVEQAAEVVSVGGHIFVGDVRNLELIDFLYQDICIEKHGVLGEEDVTLRETLTRNERELLISPTWFRQLPDQIASISSVNLSLKSGSFANELSRYRFDATLVVGECDGNLATDRFQKLRFDEITEIQDVLVNLSRRSEDKLLKIEGIPNARYRHRTKTHGEPQEFSDLPVVERAAFDPSKVVSLAEQAGLQCNTYWSQDFDPSSFDAYIFQQNSESPQNLVVERCSYDSTSGCPLSNIPANDAVDDFAVSQLTELLEANLPKYMLPSDIIIVDEIPKTPHKKTDTDRLLELVHSFGTKEPASYSLSSVEHHLSQIWADTLGRDQVSPQDNFFQLGGHSLLAINVVSQVNRLFGLKTPLKSVFERPTVREFARYLETQLSGAPIEQPRRSSLHNVQPSVGVPQLGMWLAERLSNGRYQSKVTLLVELHGDVDRERLRNSIEKTHEKHPSLRTEFRMGPEGLECCLCENEAPINEVSAPGLSDAELDALIKELHDFKFDLEFGPLYQVTLVEVEPNRIILCGVFHHIVSDDWSLSVFCADLESFYNSSEIVALDKKKLEGEYFAALAADYDYLSSGDNLSKEVNFWIKEFQDIPSDDTLPLDFQRSAEEVFTAKQKNLALELGTITKLQDFARNSDTTLFSVLLLLLKCMIHLVTGDTDIRIATNHAGRDDLSTRDKIGGFVNTLVVRNQLALGCSIAENARSVQKSLLAAHDHRRLPFETIFYTPLEEDIDFGEIDNIREVLLGKMSSECTRLVSCLRLGQTALQAYQVAVTFLYHDDDVLNLDGIECTSRSLDTWETDVEFGVFFVMNQEGLSGKFVYNEENFSDSTIEYWADLLLHLATKLVECEPHEELHRVIANVRELGRN